ncbi:MAG: DUF2505 domain-containing protein [Myxococcales bacterium]|nr:DUF2505 domain-containing protein [Myxococcales bacterium]
MTKKFTITHEFDCTPETYWRLNFDAEMNTTMYRDGLSFPEYRVEEFKETDAEIFRRTVATPKMDVPGAVQKIIGSNFRYTEETRFNKATKVAVFKGIPSTQAEKLKTDGTMRVEALGGNRCKRIVDFTVEAKIMLVGGVLEDTAEDNLRKSYSKNATFFAQWLNDKGLKGT